MTAIDGVNGHSPSISDMTLREGIGLVVSLYRQLTRLRLLNSFELQLAAEASIISSCMCAIIFIWIGVRAAFIHVFNLFDKMVHIHWHRKNSNRNLFRRPVDIYMVPNSFYAAICLVH